MRTIGASAAEQRLHLTHRRVRRLVDPPDHQAPTRRDGGAGRREPLRLESRLDDQWVLDAHATKHGPRRPQLPRARGPDDRDGLRVPPGDLQLPVDLGIVVQRHP